MGSFLNNLHSVCNVNRPLCLYNAGQQMPLPYDLSVQKLGSNKVMISWKHNTHVQDGHSLGGHLLGICFMLILLLTVYHNLRASSVTEKE